MPVRFPPATGTGLTDMIAAVWSRTSAASRKPPGALDGADHQPAVNVEPEDVVGLPRFIADHAELVMPQIEGPAFLRFRAARGRVGNHDQRLIPERDRVLIRIPPY